MTSRFFAFGCSYTKFAYATWADFVAQSFDEYYNYGTGGASNTYISDKVVEANETFKFTSTDYVIVMLTGFGRFSYYPNNHWVTNGDLYSYYANTKDSIVKNFVDSMWSENWAVQKSWIAAKTIKQILKNTPHVFLMSIDNRHYLEEKGSKWGEQFTIRPDMVSKAADIYDMLDVKESMDEWMTRNCKRTDHYIWRDDNNRLDRHPTQKMHFDFMKEKLPNFDNVRSRDFLQFANDIFIDSTQSKQHEKFYTLTHGKLSKDYMFPLFGNHR
jgi:hypothetical protein